MTHPQPHILLSLLAATFAGCVYNIWDFDRCQSDALQCREGGSVTPDPSCTRTDAMQIELGQGELRFEPLTPGQEPEKFTGAQGGYHIFVAFRLLNPALDYPELGVALQVEEEQCEPTCEWAVIAERNVVLGPDLPITSGDVVEQVGLSLIIFERGGPLRLTITLTDPCSRTGSVTHSF